MNRLEADWVYDVVLTRAYKDSVGALEKGAAFLRTCPCFWGPCQHCKTGRPDACAHRDGRAGRSRRACASIVARGGGWLADVWPAGRGCKWNCPGPDLRTMTTPVMF